MREQSLETEEDSDYIVVGFKDSRVARDLSCKNGL